MSKEKIKQEISTLNKHDLEDIKGFVDHMLTSEGKASSEEVPCDEKKILQGEYVHDRAWEKLAELGQCIEEEELERIDSQVCLIKKDMYQFHGFDSKASYAVERCLEEIASINDLNIKTFTLVKLLEGIYFRQVITKYYTQDRLEKDFTKIINDLITNQYPIDTELKREIISIYLDS